jgi:hypothetical protein
MLVLGDQGTEGTQEEGNNLNDKVSPYFQLFIFIIDGSLTNSK